MTNNFRFPPEQSPRFAWSPVGQTERKIMGNEETQTIIPSRELSSFKVISRCQKGGKIGLNEEIQCQSMPNTIQKLRNFLHFLDF